MDNDFSEAMLDLKQAPTPEHPQAIVIATLSGEHGKRQGIGVAEGYENKEQYEPQELISKAARDAVHNARSGYEKHPDHSQGEPRQESQMQTQPAKKSWKHSDKAGSISANQLGLLRTMAAERKQSLEALVNDMFGMAPEELSSEQVQHLIKQLKKFGKKS